MIGPPTHPGSMDFLRFQQRSASQLFGLRIIWDCGFIAAAQPMAGLLKRLCLLAPRAISLPTLRVADNLDCGFIAAGRPMIGLQKHPGFGPPRVLLLGHPPPPGAPGIWGVSGGREGGGRGDVNYLGWTQ